jgi:flagellin-like protein
MKGISAVIAVILLLLITISITGIAFIFFSRMQQSVQNATERQLQQQTQQFGTQFTIEGANKNQVYVRNLGTSQLTGLAFYVNNLQVNYAGPASLAPNSVGTYFLNDSQLAMLPDPAHLKVTAGIISQERDVNFYGAYTAGYWKFDEGSGTTAADSSGNGNTGTISDASWTGGVYGTALQFTGGGSTHVYVPTYSSISNAVTNHFTYSLWLKYLGISSATPWPIPIGPSNTHIYPGMRINTYNGATPSAYLEWGQYPVCDGSAYTIVGYTAINDGAWHNLVYTYDGTTVRAYIDGRFIGQATQNGMCPNFPDFYIGLYVNASIDEVRLLNVARSMTTA